MSTAARSATIEAAPTRPGLERSGASDYQRLWSMPIAEWLRYHQRLVAWDKEVRWMGVTVMKNPLDCWIYQEILWDLRPEVVVEIGSYAGGSALFLAQLMDMLGEGRVVSVDIDRSRYKVEHARITAVTGDCSSPEVVGKVRALCEGRTVLVIHDGDHAAASVERDLRLYADLVSVGSYLIVEDGIMDVYDSEPLLRHPEGGPLRGLTRFLETDGRFEVDLSRERYLITYNPRGFLKRVR